MALYALGNMFALPCVLKYAAGNGVVLWRRANIIFNCDPCALNAAVDMRIVPARNATDVRSAEKGT